MLRKMTERNAGVGRNAATSGGRDGVSEAETVNVKIVKIWIIHAMVESKE